MATWLLVACQMGKVSEIPKRAETVQTELTVIVPLVDNDGHTLQPIISQFEAFLVDNAGGWTRDTVQGAWKAGNGRIYHDSSYRYVIVGDGVKAVQDSLPRWASDLRQEALYASTRKVQVDFITPAIPAVA
jgi:hypothetical protein